MNFARLLDQAKDLWSRPVGKWLLGGIAGFIVVLAAMSYLLSRPTYVPLGRFDAADAPKVQQKLTESKILFRQSEPSFTFLVQQGDLETARLALAGVELDPVSTVWASQTWKTTWSDTEFDKRRLLEEQMENNLTRSIKTMSVVEQARVDISLPMEPKLFKEDELPPKATVVIWPRQGQKLTVQAVEAIMQIVSGAAEGLDKMAVTVVDSSTNRVVSTEAFQQKSNSQQVAGDVATGHLAVMKQFQEYWQQHLTEQLQRITGPGKVSVIVNPSINWEQVLEEALEYGQNVPLSEQRKTATKEGTGGTTTPGTSGVTPNVEVGVPSYPGAVASQAGNLTEESLETITNYLVSQTKRITEKPGGSIEELAVGVFVDNKMVTPQAEQAIKQVVTTALGTKATVEVAALPFAPSLFDDLNKTPAAPIATGAPSWLYILLVAALALGGIGLVLLAMRPRKPVLEPVFAGPEAAMMGGIPVADLEMAAAVNAYGAQQAATVAPGEKQLPESVEDIAALAPEEIALLGDEFLQQLGVDPAKVRMREKVEKIAKTNPEAVATLLKTWISEG